MAVDTYPQPGSNAELVLQHIAGNPGVSVNGIIKALRLNPATVRKCLGPLVEKGLVLDQIDERQHHHFSVIEGEVAA